MKNEISGQRLRLIVNGKFVNKHFVKARHVSTTHLTHLVVWIDL